jgi:hypothetical protein
MDMLILGPGYDYELDNRRESLSRLWGRPAWLPRRADRAARDRAQAPGRREATAQRATGRGRALRGSGAWPTA